MLKQHVRLVSTSLYITDIALTAASFFLAYLLRANYLPHFEFVNIGLFENYSWLILIIIAVWTALFFYFGLYKSHRTTPLIVELKTLWKVILIGSLVIGAVIFSFKFYYLSRTLIFMFFAINAAILTIERILIRGFSRCVRSRGYNFRNVMIAGCDDSARALARAIENKSVWGLRIIGFVSDDNSNGIERFCGYRVLGKIGDIGEIVKKEIVDEVIFTISQNKLQELEETLLLLEDHGINTRIVVDFFPHAIAKVSLEELDGVPLLTFTTTPADDFTLAVKRLFDVMVSLAALIILSPVMLALSLSIKSADNGPVFFRQKRCGRNGRVFTLYKFRSMVSGAEDKKRELETLNEMDGPVFKITNDPRTTRIGRFIRKFSMDELPQFWNVLKGDMSIVGPRPPLPEEVDGYKRWQRRRLSMKPGLTCLWQISGRNKVTDFNEWVKLDLEYIDRWSLMLDMKIFLKTIPAVLFGKGAA